MLGSWSPTRGLPDVIRRPGGWRWFAGGEPGREAVATVESGLLAEPPATDVEVRAVHERSSRQAVLLQHDERVVFCKRIRARDAVDSLRETLRLGELLGRSGAVVETERALRLRASLEHGPRLLALGERRRMGIVREQILVFEALLGHRGMLAVLEEAGSTDEKLELVDRAHHLVAELDSAGLTHLDFHAGNVMLSLDDPRSDCVVDLVQVREVGAHRLTVLAFVLGHFFQHRLSAHVPRSAYGSLAEARLSRFGGEADVAEALPVLRYFMQRPLKRRHRHRLAWVGLRGMPLLAARIRAWSARR